jgi:hypothetical protein
MPMTSTITKFRDYVMEGPGTSSDEQRAVTLGIQTAVAKVLAKEEQNHIVFESLFTPPENDLFDQHPQIGMKSIMGPDTLYLWEARKTERLSKILRGHSKGNQ